MTDLHQTSTGIRLAIEGCGHGTLHAVYASVSEACKRKSWPGVDLLIICGDFQAVRNAYDLNCVNMPAKYRHMGDFHEYYSGKREAPYLTVFVGGNHEASNYLFELYYGGWVARNIYYLGAAGVVHLGPLRIAGLSGIWKGYSYRKPHFERLPYNENDLRTIYDVRELDVRKLLQIRSQVDIGISHDWPNGVEWKGDWKQLFRFKAHLEPDAQSGRLGSLAAKEVLDWLRPKLWFSAHLHCKYAAVVLHGKEVQSGETSTAGSQMAGRSKNDDEIDLDDDDAPPADRNADEIDLDLSDEAEPASSTKHTNGTTAINKDEIDLDLDEEVSAPVPVEATETNGTESSLDAARAILPESFRRPPPPEIPKHPSAISNTSTKFLALDKCLPGRRFLQLEEIPNTSAEPLDSPLRLQYDREWLSITRAFAVDEPLTLGDPDAFVKRAKNHSEYAKSIERHRKWIDDNLGADELVIPLDFEVVAPVYDGGDWNEAQYQQVREVPNPQTARFCQMLRIPNAFEITEEEIESRFQAGPRPDDNSHHRGGNRGGRGQHHSRGNRGGRGGRGGFRGRGRGRGGNFMPR